ncbi:hypothetical protein ACFO3I_17325 [Rheinheimera marina]|uniref:O-antigen ligase domain-containing protein n=1 Tax=Rheinheimera marina TaxID=1774958 RepID=A0ABV9JRD2_9GAMM
MNKLSFLHVFYILTCVSALQIPFIGGIEVGPISLNSLKDVFIYVFLLWYIFDVYRLRYPVDGVFFYAFIVFSFFITLSLIVSPAIMSGVQYFIKITFPFLVYYAIKYGSFRDVSLSEVINNVLCVYILFCVVSLVLGGEQDGVYAGVTDRHFFKFNAAFLFVLSFAVFAKNGYGIYQFVGLLVSLASILIVMQRGAFISVSIACFVILFLRGYLEGWRLFVSFLAISLAIFALFTNEKFVEYSFYEGMGPDYIISETLKGRFDVEFIRDRERGVLMESILDQHQFGFFPSGLGTAKSLINNDYTFFEGKEPHNDLLVLAVDTGLGGFIISVIMLCFIFFKVRAFHKVRRLVFESDAFLMFGVGSGLIFGYFVWMSFSNVVIYSSSSFALPFAFMAISERYINSKGYINGQ